MLLPPGGCSSSFLRSSLLLFSFFLFSPNYIPFLFPLLTGGKTFSHTLTPVTPVTHSGRWVVLVFLSGMSGTADMTHISLSQASRDFHGSCSSKAHPRLSGFTDGGLAQLVISWSWSKSGITWSRFEIACVIVSPSGSQSRDTVLGVRRWKSI